MSSERNNTQEVLETTTSSTTEKTLDFIPDDMIIPPNRRVHNLGNIRWLLANLATKNRRHPKFCNISEQLWVELRKFRQ